MNVNIRLQCNCPRESKGRRELSLLQRIISPRFLASRKIHPSSASCPQCLQPVEKVNPVLVEKQPLVTSLTVHPVRCLFCHLPDLFFSNFKHVKINCIGGHHKLKTHNVFEGAYKQRVEFAVL